MFMVDEMKVGVNGIVVCLLVLGRLRGMRGGGLLDLVMWLVESVV